MALLEPSDRAEVIGALAAEIRELLGRTPSHQRLIAVPFAIEEGLHETFEWFLRGESAVSGAATLGGLWKNRRPRSELERLAAELEVRASAMGREPADRSDVPSPLSPPEGHVPADEICEEYPDVAGSLGKLVRVLAENPEIRRHGPSPLRLSVHLEDFAVLAARVRGAPRAD